ncbi:Cytosolic Fe-S cluster assembly factor NUBP2-like protein [Trichoplax sp. H2]|uniref:Cytosolic Fe-S cluster assembly factor NUBP2 homolog n=1 Tax=Trichoplax adhaerens TaxID=10228 RepID=NUBP2_TRIAD|nr:hypothetical protein TRIADDRAFT_53697 [Trichoplax adhaerens]B3RPX4.1 RecName: Full=Cytosolic Fe-S cluster assembly factor NUBP2 homolog [Trichoplax adhaerens]EDV27718.1 hypothetical protein TRIADDRAFT_53697 [Trichoplax adhaerens]RDD42091.1 Cytosolic Fe-S cluster assembly factor NUBP2-like protein [Trichoplax sp. H2]|eukprot:XP_002109552.1 hypothetical protein TRIADDRAFT_53697 [Trichoplax adhaerens]
MAEEGAQKATGKIKSVVLILSGKGGVGKSTVASQIALELANGGNKVGILDVDLCGPSIPRVLGLEDKDVHQCADGWIPVYADKNEKLAVMSIGFLLRNSKDAVVWRGPKKNAMIKQFLSDVVWGDLDYLIIDTPPGTSDEHITVAENVRGLNLTGAVMVTTPQAVALGDVRREITFCKKVGIPIVGIVENMSGYTCPNCSECTNIFSKGGGEALAQLTQVPFLGCLPLDPKLTMSIEDGKSFTELYSESPTALAIREIIRPLITS